MVVILTGKGNRQLETPCWVFQGGMDWYPGQKGMNAMKWMMHIPNASTSTNEDGSKSSLSIMMQPTKEAEEAAIKQQLKALNWNCFHSHDHSDE